MLRKIEAIVYKPLQMVGLVVVVIDAGFTLYTVPVGSSGILRNRPVGLVVIIVQGIVQ